MAWSTAKRGGPVERKPVKVTMGGKAEAERSYAKILPFLYLGDEETASDLKTLQTLKIQFVLNATEDVEDFFATSGIKYLKLNISDWEYEDITKHFPESNGFIEEARQSGSCCLVHCSGGLSRGPAIVIAYLMKHQDLPLKEAYKLVKDVKSGIEPNEGFVKQLLKYEESFGKLPSMTIEDFSFSAED